jgi:hypothetical protein
LSEIAASFASTGYISDADLCAAIEMRHALAIQTKIDQLLISSQAGNYWVGIARRVCHVIDGMRSLHHCRL